MKNMGFNNKYCQTCFEFVASYLTVCPNCQTPLIYRPIAAPFEQPNYSKRPLGVIIIIILLSLGTLFDLAIFSSDIDLLLLAVFFFRLFAIAGLVVMTSWGYWLVIILYSFQILMGFADITIFMEDNIRMIAEANFVSPSDPRVRSIIQSSLTMGFLGVLTVSSIILYYLSRKRRFFK